jgi:hypothetical protein
MQAHRCLEILNRVEVAILTQQRVSERRPRTFSIRSACLRSPTIRSGRRLRNLRRPPLERLREQPYRTVRPFVDANLYT